MTNDENSTSQAINRIALETYKTSAGKGWHDDLLCKNPQETFFEDKDVDVERVAAKVALIHSEVSEALEELRVGRLSLFYDEFDQRPVPKPEGFVVEMADAMIRILDTCQALGLDIGEAVAMKMRYNETRPHRHGGKKL